MARLIMILVLVAAIAGGIWWWLNQPVPEMAPVGNETAAVPEDSTVAIEEDLNATAVADIEAEFREIDGDINSL